MTQASEENIELRSLLTEDGTLRLALQQAEIPEPRPGEVVIRVEAAPINPSDIINMIGMADPASATAETQDGLPALKLTVPPGRLEHSRDRMGQKLSAGNEGAGTVIKAGAGAEALIGRKVAAFSGTMYSRYCLCPSGTYMPLPEGTSAQAGAAAFVNPLTALGMVETMRREGHKAIVHAAAASNLGQMLNRVCIADGIDLVNIVRRDEQADLLRKQGAQIVLNSSDENFKDQLVDALCETGATIAFDPIGGGKLADTIINAMEKAINRVNKPARYNRYGSSTLKQVYIYGLLDSSPTIITRAAGLSWSVGGWLLTNFLAKIGKDAEQLRARVVAELGTTFASSYAAEIGLEEMLEPRIFAAYTAMQTGQKFLVTPSKIPA